MAGQLASQKLLASRGRPRLSVCSLPVPAPARWLICLLINSGDGRRPTRPVPCRTGLLQSAGTGKRVTSVVFGRQSMRNVFNAGAPRHALIPYGTKITTRNERIRAGRRLMTMAAALALFMPALAVRAGDNPPSESQRGEVRLL